MRRSSLLLAVAVAASLGAKLVINQQPTNQASEIAALTMKRKATLFLDSAGLQTMDLDAKTGSGGQDNPFVTARAGACRVIVASVSPEGWLEAALYRQADEDDRVFFVFRHAVYDRQPVWATWSAFQLQRFASFFGVPMASLAIYGVVESPACGAQHIPWAAIDSAG